MRYHGAHQVCYLRISFGQSYGDIKYLALIKTLSKLAVLKHLTRLWPRVKKENISAKPLRKSKFGSRSLLHLAPESLYVAISLHFLFNKREKSRSTGIQPAACKFMSSGQLQMGSHNHVHIYIHIQVRSPLLLRLCGSCSYPIPWPRHRCSTARGPGPHQARCPSNPA